MSYDIDPLPRGWVPLPQMAYIALLHTIPRKYKLGPGLQLWLG